ncbi:MAG TPA: Hsp20/alpha crystallin family protein [Gemmatimonadales bacterium]|nr:Hsp20/alpha crystallin family protein [Gemmatimonadales bacterium]
MQITRRPDVGPEFSALRRLNRMLDEMFAPLGLGFEQAGSITSAWFPPTDVFEDRDSFKLVMEIPGVRSEDVKLSLENNILTIRGEKKQEAEEKTERVHRYERTYGVFERTFSLPTNVDVDQIEATCENGILTVTMPKAERARPREIPIGGGTQSQLVSGESGREGKSPSEGGRTGTRQGGSAA